SPEAIAWTCPMRTPPAETEFTIANSIAQANAEETPDERTSRPLATPLQGPLRRLDDVAQQQRPRHRTDAAGVGADPPGHLGNLGRDVAGDPALAVGALDPADAHVEHCRTRLDHVGADHPRFTCGGHDDVGPAHLCGEVAGP